MIESRIFLESVSGLLEIMGSRIVRIVLYGPVAGGTDSPDCQDFVFPDFTELQALYIVILLIFLYALIL